MVKIVVGIPVDLCDHLEDARVGGVLVRTELADDVELVVHGADSALGAIALLRVVGLEHVALLVRGRSRSAVLMSHEHLLSRMSVPTLPVTCGSP